MDARLAAVVTLLGSLVLGAVLAVVISSLSARLPRSDGKRQPGVKRVVFFTVALVGVIAALAVLDEEALDAIPEQALAFVPRLLGAGVLLGAGWLLANVVARLVDQAVSRGTGRSLPAASGAAKWSVLGTAMILALGQLGIETLFLVIATSVALGTIGLVIALLAVAAGGDLAKQAAHGRHLRRQLSVGDRVQGDGFAGSVVRVDATSTVLDLGDGGQMLVPNAQLLDRPVTIRKA